MGNETTYRNVAITEIAGAFLCMDKVCDSLAEAKSHIDDCLNPEKVNKEVADLKSKIDKLYDETFNKPTQ